MYTIERQRENSCLARVTKRLIEDGRSNAMITMDFQKTTPDLQATNIYISSKTRKSQNDCCRTYSYLINGENSKIEAIIVGEHYAGSMNCI